MKPAEELVYSNTLEGLRLALLKHGVAASVVDPAFKVIGIDFAKMLPAYTRAQFIDALHTTAKLAFPDLGSEPAFRGVGRLVVEGYVETVLGRAVHAAARLMGPMWTLKRMTRNLRTSDNCTEARADEKGPTEVSIWINDHLGCHGYYEGIFETIVKVAGGSGARTELTGTKGPREATYRVRWEKG
ncbi:MAG: DUF2378 family protein [Myxococcaceae bacterium]|nr:DUF2378 family protein [Myxococcaceae bacterium]